MPSRFDDLFAATGAPTLIDMFGEPVVYYPGGDTDAGRSISAMIEREVQVISHGEIMGFVTVVRVLDSSTEGISATEINTGRDTIRIQMRRGESSRLKQITKVLSTENGIVRFQLN